MRRGELLALQWCDIDLDRATLRVERSVEETRRGLRVKPPKTKRGRRNIALPPETVAMLRDHGKKQIERRLALGQGGQPVLVFSTVEGGLLSSDNLSRDWGRVCWRFHALRHTHTSLLLSARVPVCDVSTVVRVSPKAGQIVFGQVGETEVSFHTAVAMTRANAEGLAKTILEGLSATKNKARAVRKMTVSGGVIH